MVERQSGKGRSREQTIRWGTQPVQECLPEGKPEVWHTGASRIQGVELVAVMQSEGEEPKPVDKVEVVEHWLEWAEH